VAIDMRLSLPTTKYDGIWAIAVGMLSRLSEPAWG
jgi:hypothetical protein